MWSPADIVDAAAEAIRRAESRLCEEQAIEGIDALQERALQAMLEGAFSAAGWTVARETRYPSARPRSRAAGARCDLVLTHGAPLQPDAMPSLFDPAEPTPPEGACWIEVKMAAALDVEGAAPAYARVLSDAAIRDAAALASEPLIRHGMLLFVLLGASEESLRRDVTRWVDETLATGIPGGQPRVRTLPIRDLRGNAVAAIACVPVSPREPA
jgi:hypothetical protein